MESRVDIINFLANRFGYKSYLEIGLRHPWECSDNFYVNIGEGKVLKSE